MLDSTSLATRRIGAISTKEEGTTSLSKIGSPKFPAVWVRKIRLGGGWSDPLLLDISRPQQISTQATLFTCQNQSSKIKKLPSNSSVWIQIIGLPQFHYIYSISPWNSKKKKKNFTQLVHNSIFDSIFPPQIQDTKKHQKAEEAKTVYLVTYYYFGSLP